MQSLLWHTLSISLCRRKSSKFLLKIQQVHSNHGSNIPKYSREMLNFPRLKYYLSLVISIVKWNHMLQNGVLTKKSQPSQQSVCTCAAFAIRPMASVLGKDKLFFSISEEGWALTKAVVTIRHYPLLKPINTH